MRSEAPSRGFETREYEARLTAVQSRMDNVGMAALLLMTEPEVRYFTGFHTAFWQSPTRPWFVIIPASGKPIAIIPDIGAALMRTTWVEDIRTWSAPDPKDDGISLLVDALSSFKGPLGVLKGHETHLRMPLGDWERLCAQLPALGIKDATGIVQGLRMIKSPAEIEKIAHICAIGSATFARVPDLIHEGIPLDHLFRRFREEALVQGADEVPYLVGAANQGGYCDVISPPTATPIRTGDILMLDTGCVWDGYFCDFDRNWSIGRPDPEAARAYDVLWRATQAGLEAAKPGASARDLAHAMARVLAEMDTSGGDIGRLGHGLGMQLTEQPSLASFDRTILAEGMVLTLEPSLTYNGGLMMVHEENIVIEASGPRLLTDRAPNEFPVVA